MNGLLNTGTISRSLMPYFIKHGDVLVCQKRDNPRSAYLAISQPTMDESVTPRTVQSLRHAGFGENEFMSFTAERDANAQILARQANKGIAEFSGRHFEAQNWYMQTEMWNFDCNFQKDNETISLRIPSDRKEILLIQDLEIYPILYAKPEMIKVLEDVGLQFWKSRFRRYVSYHPVHSTNGAQAAEPRYMIDPAIHKKLHKKDYEESLRDDLGSQGMSADQPPSGPFLLLLPNTINGFNMQNKRWEELEVARISDVSWNKEAFESLVVKPFTKKSIKGLVMQQIEGERSTGFMAGKGKGLIILLYSGPGTGKTFTAETVAEIAESPSIVSHVEIWGQS